MRAKDYHSKDCQLYTLQTDRKREIKPASMSYILARRASVQQRITLSCPVLSVLGRESEREKEGERHTQREREREKKVIRCNLMS